jgi:hypothetical protein
MIPTSDMSVFSDLFLAGLRQKQALKRQIQWEYYTEHHYALSAR